VSEYLLLLLGTALVNNVVLVKFLGLCPFMGVSKKLDSALSMGLATTFVLTLAAMTSWMLEHFILAPFNIQFLRILAFILVIACGAVHRNGGIKPAGALTDMAFSRR
jgi:electron transport complex protein RnfA